MRQKLASDCAAASDARTEGLWSGTAAARSARSVTIQRTTAYAALHDLRHCCSRPLLSVRSTVTHSVMKQQTTCLKKVVCRRVGFTGGRAQVGSWEQGQEEGETPARAPLRLKQCTALAQGPAGRAAPPVRSVHCTVVRAPVLWSGSFGISLAESGTQAAAA